MMVESLCAMSIVIWYFNEETLMMVFVISSSVNESSDEVASSKINSLGLRKRDLAMESLCFSPPDNL